MSYTIQASSVAGFVSINGDDYPQNTMAIKYNGQSGVNKRFTLYIADTKRELIDNAKATDVIGVADFDALLTLLSSLSVFKTASGGSGAGGGLDASGVRSTVLTGLSTATNAVITASDSILSAFGKLQSQVSYILGLVLGYTAQVDTIQDLKDLSPSGVKYARTNGYLAAGDVKGWKYEYDSSVTDSGLDNGGRIIKSDVAAGSWVALPLSKYTPEMYGAVRGNTDSHLALQEWAGDSGAPSPVLYASEGDYFTSSGTITAADKVLQIHCELRYTGATTAATAFFEHSVSSGMEGYEHWISVYDPSFRWTGNRDYVGFKSGNDTSGIYNVNANGFEIGHHAQSDGTGVRGIQMCLFRQGNIYNNRIGMLADCINTGWFNKNKISGGYWWQFSTNQNDTTRYGLVFGEGDQTYVQNNTNVVEDIDVELNTVALTGGAEGIGILIEAAQGTRGRDLRFERSGDIGVRIQSQILSQVEQNKNNVFEVNYETVTIDDLSQTKANHIFRYDQEKERAYEVTRFDSILDLDLSGADKTVLHRGATFVLNNFSTQRRTTLDASTLTSNSITFTEQNDGVLMNNTGISVIVKSDVAKKFKVSYNKTGGRLSVRCYDSSKNEITTTDGQADTSLVALSGGAATFSSSLFGGSFREAASDSTDHHTVTVGASVEYTEFIFGIGAASIELASFQIKSIGEHATIIKL